MTSVPVRGRRSAWLPGRHGHVGPCRRAVLLAAALTALSTASVAPVAAQGRRTVVVPQPLVVITHRDLTFGNVLPGIPMAVNARDIERAALFEVRGPEDAVVRLEFVLPDNMRNDRGGLFPIIFAATDGNASFTLTPSPGGFSPNAPLISTLGTEGRIYIRLGGSVQPGLPQQGGAYSATIHLTVFDVST
jgi:hypothetical protein